MNSYSLTVDQIKVVLETQKTNILSSIEKVLLDKEDISLIDALKIINSLRTKSFIEFIEEDSVLTIKGTINDKQDTKI